MVSAAVSFLRSLFGVGIGPPDADGFGQSLADDIRFARNFRQCRRSTVVWRVPTPEEAEVIEHDPIVGRFGDMTIGVADVAGRHWMVRERDWHGWPDPPRFVFFALEGEQVWAGADFDRWPQAWRWPERAARLSDVTRSGPR